MTARDLFEAARGAAREVERARVQLDGMEARALSVGGGGVTGMPHAQRHDVNGTAASDALMDHEAMLRSRIRDDEALLALAREVCYGADMGGGVSALLGTTYADVLWWRFCRAADWGTVSRMLDVSVSSARRYADIALDVADSYGVEAMRRGLGFAED